MAENPPVYCVALLLPKEQRQAAIELNDRMRNLNGSALILGAGAEPHSTVLQCCLQPGMLRRAKKDLENLAKQLGPVYFQTVLWDITEAQMGEAYAYKSPHRDPFDHVQKQVIEVFDPLRGGLKPPYDAVGVPFDKDWENAASSLELENFKNYGFTQVGKLNAQHVTAFRRTVTSNGPQGLDLVEQAIIVRDYARALDGWYDTLALYRMGPNGSCVEHIASAKLRGTASPLPPPRGVRVPGPQGAALVPPDGQVQWPKPPRRGRQVVAQRGSRQPGDGRPVTGGRTVR